MWKNSSILLWPTMNKQYIWEILTWDQSANHEFIKTLNGDIVEHFSSVENKIHLRKINTDCSICFNIYKVETLGIWNHNYKNEYKITLFSYSRNAGTGQITLRNIDGFGLKLFIQFTDSELEYINNNIF